MLQESFQEDHQQRHWKSEHILNSFLLTNLILYSKISGDISEKLTSKFDQCVAKENDEL